jgi:colicin import membrane protein
MKLVLSIAAGIILAVVLLAVGCSALVASSVDDATPVAAASDAVADAAPVTSGDVSQDNAQESAESYLDSGSFSRSGLIHQLKFEGYSTADATAAVDAVSPDWNAQAAKTAAGYLDSGSFSRSGLIHQLEFEGFTASQAAYGVNQAGY